MTNRKADLQAAKNNSKDEFYTSLVDIENEMKHHKSHFKDKVVFCNCDDDWSEFFKFFKAKFHEYGLKKLIATNFKYDKKFSTYRLDYDGKNTVKTPLEFNGSFSSAECVDILHNEADICVTNPPFSLFRDFISLLMDSGKKFIIMGNVNALTYKEVIPHYVNNELWLGPSITCGDREFRVPDDYPLQAAGFRVDKDGNKYIRVKGIRWFTNIPHNKKKAKLIPFRKYDPALYPKYGNFDAIEVSKTVNIPVDYEGIMGVPITFMDKFDPDQFEILGVGVGNFFTPNKTYSEVFQVKKDGTRKKSGSLNKILTIETDEVPEGNYYESEDSSKKYIITPYARILIRKIQN